MPDSDIIRRLKPEAILRLEQKLFHRPLELVASSKLPGGVAVVMLRGSYTTSCGVLTETRLSIYRGRQCMVSVITELSWS